MIKSPKWLWFLDLTIGIVFVSGIGSFFVWRRSEDFRKDTFSRVPLIAEYFYRAEDIIAGQLQGTRLKRKDYSGFSVYLAYEKWQKKQSPKAMPVQSLERFEKMMESMEGSMMKPKTSD